MARITTRTLAASAAAAVTLGTTGAVLAPANAGGWGGHHHDAGLSLTRSAAATLDRYDVKVDVTRSSRLGHHAFLRGAVVFTGDATTRWSSIRVNQRTHRVTAIVNGDRKPVLRFRGTCSGHDDRFGHHRGGTVLRLTRAGATSIDHAAGADAFDAGDAFATTGRR